MSATLVAAHQRDIEALLRIAEADLSVVWRQVTSADAAREALMDLLPQLAAVYGSAAATLGADWYDDMREVADVRGRFRAIPADLPDRGRTDALARWGIGPLFGADPDFTAAQALIWGGFQRIVADADRDTVMRSLVQDPQGAGWSRATGGKSCDFCVQIAAKGAVYSAKTAAFSSHDDCKCIAVPAYGRGHRVREFTPSQRFRSDEAKAAHNARTREWLNATT